MLPVWLFPQYRINGKMAQHQDTTIFIGHSLYGILDIFG